MDFCHRELKKGLAPFTPRIGPALQCRWERCTLLLPCGKANTDANRENWGHFWLSGKPSLLMKLGGTLGNISSITVSTVSLLRRVGHLVAFLASWEAQYTCEFGWGTWEPFCH